MGKVVAYVCRDHFDAQSGRIKCGYTSCREGVTRKDFSVARTLTVTFSEPVPSEATLEETKLIFNCWIKFGSSHDCLSIIQSGLIAGGKDTKEGRHTVFFITVDPMNELREDELYDETKARQVPDRTRWKVFQNARCCINLRRAQDKGLAFWQTRSNAIVLHDYQPTVLNKR